jgi:hypothetical protein
LGESEEAFDAVFLFEENVKLHENVMSILLRMNGMISFRRDAKVFDVKFIRRS